MLRPRAAGSRRPRRARPAAAAAHRRGSGHDGRDRLHDRLDEQRPLGVIAPGPQHGPAVLGRFGREGLRQRRLPDARLADDHDEPGMTAGGRIPCLPEHPYLAVPPGQGRPAWLRAAQRRPAWYQRRRGAARQRSAAYVIGEAAAAAATAEPTRDPAFLLAQDGQVQLPRLRRRIGAKLVAEPLPERFIRGQGLGLLARRGRGRHVPAMSRLVERVGRHSRLRVAHRQRRASRRQRRLGRGQASPAQQLAHLFTGPVRPVRVRLVVDRRARGQQLKRALRPGRATAAAVASLLSA